MFFHTLKVRGALRISAFALGLVGLPVLLGANPLGMGFDTGSNDQDFHRLLQEEQSFFFDQEGYHRAPLHPEHADKGGSAWAHVQGRRQDYRGFDVLDSAFDVYWDTPAYESDSNATALIAHLFRDATIFPEPPGYSRRTSTGITVSDLMRVAISRQEGRSSEAYPIFGYWSLMDFSKANQTFVKRYLDAFAKVSFRAQARADFENGPSYERSFRLAEDYIQRTGLPCYALLNGRGVLIHKIVRRRADQAAALFYWDPQDPPSSRLANEFYGKNVIYVVRDPVGTRFFKIRDFDGRSFGLEACGPTPRPGVHQVDLQPITDMASVYREIAPSMQTGAHWASLRNEDGPSRRERVRAWTNLFVGGALIAHGLGEKNAPEVIAGVGSAVLGQSVWTLPADQRQGLPRPVSDGLYLDPASRETWMAPGSAPGPYYQPSPKPYDLSDPKWGPVARDPSGKIYQEGPDLWPQSGTFPPPVVVSSGTLGVDFGGDYGVPAGSGTSPGWLPPVAPPSSGGFSKDGPWDQGGSYPSYPGDQAGYDPKDPGKPGGYDQAGPWDQGNAYPSYPGDQSGYDPKDPWSQGGYDPTGPWDQGNTYPPYPGDQAGYDPKDPWNQGGYDPTGPWDQGGHDQTGPWDQGGSYPPYPPDQAGYDPKDPWDQGGWNPTWPSYPGTQNPPRTPRPDLCYGLYPPDPVTGQCGSPPLVPTDDMMRTPPYDLGGLGGLGDWPWLREPGFAGGIHPKPPPRYYPSAQNFVQLD